MNYLRVKLSSDDLRERILFTVILFLICFFGIVTISYFLLPEGLLQNKNPLQNWNTSTNTYVAVLQIFFYNLISVLFIFLGSLMGQKKEADANYFSFGYTTFFLLISVNAIYLGSWSFSVASAPLPLIGRFAQVFDVLHRGGLWEMTGQLLITCAAAHTPIVLTSGKNTVTRKFRDIRLTRSEILVILAGIILILTGAVVEAIAINSR